MSINENGDYQNDMNALEVPQATQDFLIYEQERINFNSEFSFLREHKGWRSGKMALLLAPTHAGKSTFVRSILWDAVINNPGINIGIWLSEESVSEFRTEVAKMRIPWSTITCLIDVFSEQDDDLSIDSIEKRIRAKNYELLIFDNITTSQVYNNKTNYEQARISKRIKKITQDVNCSTIIIAHTDGKAGTKNSLIEENNIRGDKSLPNLVQFCYALQRFYISSPDGGDVYYTIIRTLKHRGYNCKNILHQLVYTPESFSFQRDHVIPWDKFKEVYDNRRTL